jgi:hypothetical protein
MTNHQQLRSGDHPIPGPVLLFGSGETSPSGQKIFNHLFRRLLVDILDPAGIPTQPALRVAILETPAGFELNSAQVAGRVGEFLRHHLQNYCLQVAVIPARRRGTPDSPDNPSILAPLLHAEIIFMGPGSPTYAVRQLQDSQAWHLLVARHRLGGALALASAASIAAGVCALPVYEIYKVGEDIHWKPGLDLFGPYNLSLVFIPHWNNADGGEELDTSRCFMGRARFAALLERLPPGVTVVGIDEGTGLLLDLEGERCQVVGRDGVTLLRAAGEWRFSNGDTFSIQELGDFRPLDDPRSGLPAGIWRQANEALDRPAGTAQVPADILALVEARQAARQSQDWPRADRLREQIAALGWQVVDTAEGPRIVREKRE